MKPNFVFMLMLGILLSSASCKKDDPVAPNPDELITTMTLRLTPFGGGTVRELSFRDLDGNGGQAPVIEVDPLEETELYHCSITLLNESVNPAENITTEINMEKEQHQFFFQPTGLMFNITYLDMDSLGYPVGLLTTIGTFQDATGTLKVTLRHMPDKAAAGVSNGDITNAGGDTDIEVTFPITIQ